MLSAVLGLAVCVVVLVAGSQESDDWSSYKAEHGKSYATQLEDSLRAAIFLRNKEAIGRFNSLRSKDSASYELGLNQFSDWTGTELERFFAKRGLSGTRLFASNNSREDAAFVARALGNSSDPLPDSVDWRSEPGRVTSVKNQGECGANWAFAATGVLEGQELRVTKSKELVGLSAQQLLDCNPGDGCYTSMWPTSALQSVFEQNGIATEKDYPYEAKTDICILSSENAFMLTRGPIVLPGNEETLERAVANYGPVVVAFNAADPQRLIAYKSGVFKQDKCPTELNDGYAMVFALVVGYGNDPKEGDYWIVKLSWGDKWGESGYLRIARNMNNMCGIASEPVIAAF